MPLYRIRKESELFLLKSPESGMGFQVLRYRENILLTFNATIALSLKEYRERRFSEEEYNFLSGDPDDESLTQLEQIEFMDNYSIVFSNLDTEYQDRSLDLLFNEVAAPPPSYIISPNRPYSYYRFTPYYKDKRVNKYGNFLPGTYATTYNDLHFVPSGYAAVGRYALPNPASAQFVFQIVTFCTPTLMGTATPNFGQAGGGVEVLFGDGARHHTGYSFMINAG